MLQAQNLKKSFGCETAIQNLSVTITKGEILGLLGPNGAGKTTIIRLFNGLLKPTEGSVNINGVDPIQSGEKVRRICGTLTEQPGLYEEMTGKENLDFFANLFAINPRARIDELSDLLSLTSFLDRKVGTYSTGMKKRLGLAKVLLHKPEVLFLDEPTNGLDPDGTNDVLAYLEGINQQEGTTIVLCSHVLSQLEHLCTRYVFLERGVKQAEGTIAELRQALIKELVVHLHVEDWQDIHQFAEYEPKQLERNLYSCKVSGYEALPELLKEVARVASLYGAQVKNDGLESIYFQVRRGHYE
ncbi:ABC transporter ATP-binding protein [Shouchella shacheensis]|uniref:ABC transporter ATP-binding protein n=1 Tax=Shouchella shacheensis TaxID=1649580 RepID=UPI00073FCEC6|nr:ABC transporter ATP-binding protein [Shouchella shacheensis]